MAGGGYKKPQFMSRAMRPGGYGTVEPKKPALDLGTLKGPKTQLGPSGPTELGKGVPTVKMARGGKLGPTMPKIPKLPTIKPVKF